MEEVVLSQERFCYCTVCRDAHPAKQIRALGRGHICKGCLKEAREAGHQDRTWVEEVAR